jgi:hypothetical protein
MIVEHTWMIVYRVQQRLRIYTYFPFLYVI